MDALRAAERALERVVSMVAENEERGEDATRPRTETPRAKLQERLEALERLNAGPAASLVAKAVCELRAKLVEIDAAETDAVPDRAEEPAGADLSAEVSRAAAAVAEAVRLASSADERSVTANERLVAANERLVADARRRSVAEGRAARPRSRVATCLAVQAWLVLIAWAALAYAPRGPVARAS
ncbi:hypothetical protein M885DRAFT_521428 [Pelagophyceae sp. CCMP2097]|nr:hypothetical protein M885DRAFT_521428 [Pelagophyceae sp. CCMP2097]|mmetsp:Transcript_17537/g.60651  ORF Transcript_17537/g.60651 Transcript_17537/m.60651 type:complete len:184 (+) Transcript_17537:292-843(+)